MDAAVLLLMGIWAGGLYFAEREKYRLRFIHAMRLCTLRLSDLVCCASIKYPEMLLCIHLYENRQQRQLTRILHAAASRLLSSSAPQALGAFEKACSGALWPGVIQEADCAAFQSLLDGLGRQNMGGCQKCLDAANTYLGKREQVLESECAVRASLIKALSVACCAAAYIMLA